MVSRKWSLKFQKYWEQYKKKNHQSLFENIVRLFPLGKPDDTQDRKNQDHDDGTYFFTGNRGLDVKKLDEPAKRHGKKYTPKIEKQK